MRPASGGAGRARRPFIHERKFVHMDMAVTGARGRGRTGTAEEGSVGAAGAQGLGRGGGLAVAEAFQHAQHLAPGRVGAALAALVVVHGAEELALVFGVVTAGE